MATDRLGERKGAGGPLLRHDGLYQSSDQLDPYDMVWYWFYLWFTPGGEVMMATYAGPPEEAVGWLRNGGRFNRGSYQANGSQVSGRIDDGGVGVAFEGTVVAGRLELRADDGIGYFPPSDTFRFVPVAILQR